MMRSKRGASFSSQWTYVIVVFIFVLFIGGISALVKDLIASPTTNLDTKSVAYANRITGIDTSNYVPSAAQMQQNYVIGDKNINSTSSNAKDFSIEYYDAQKRTDELQTKVGIGLIYSMPERVLVTLLGAPKTEFQWMLDTINWFFWVAMGIAVYLFIRGMK